MTSEQKKRAWLAARIVFTVGAFVWILNRVALNQIWDATQRLPIVAVIAACAITSLNIVVSSLRWKVLLRAYGAEHAPPLSTLVRLSWVGYFYNTWLPGGVGGDALRGVASRAAFGDRGVTSAMAVVFVDRVLGLVGLLLVVAITNTIAPLASAGPNVVLFSSLGIVVGAMAVASIMVAHRLANRLPSALRPIASRLPKVEAPSFFFVGILLSLGTQTLVAITGHAILAGLCDQIAITDSLVAVPLAMATAFLPFLVGGTGAREAIFALLLVPLGMPEHDAIAAGLIIYGTQLIVALAGAFLPSTMDPQIPAGRSAGGDESKVNG